MQVQLPAQERNWAMAAHLSALVAFAGFPLGHIIGPLVVYLIKARESAFVAEHARASLNYQITVSILTICGAIAAVAVMFGLIVPLTSSASAAAGVGLVAVWIVFGAAAVGVIVASIVFIVLGTIAASDGRPYTYPFAIRFLR
jgi:hypothetical protein